MGLLRVKAVALVFFFPIYLMCQIDNTVSYSEHIHSEREIQFVDNLHKVTFQNGNDQTWVIENDDCHDLAIEPIDFNKHTVVENSNAVGHFDKMKPIEIADSLGFSEIVVGLGTLIFRDILFDNSYKTQEVIKYDTLNSVTSYMMLHRWYSANNTLILTIEQEVFNFLAVLQLTHRILINEEINVEGFHSSITSLSPNPAINEITIDLLLIGNEPVLISIVDVAGKKVVEANEQVIFENVGVKKMTLRVDALTSGSYSIILESEGIIIDQMQFNITR